MEEDEEKESDEDVDENYSGSASSEASEVDSEEGSVSGWRKRDRDDEAAEVVEEEWKSGNAAEKVGTKNLSATTVTQTKIVDEAIDSSKEKGPSLEERENDGGHKMAERIAKPVISKPVSQVMERRVSGASDSEPPLSDSRRSPDPELLRQMRGSFLKQLEQQKAGKKGVDDDKGHEDQNRSRLGSEQ
uniref:Uncharacterized protein n=1 Tax=Plectus sambesii TaxID=2011161 RepID=A0A914VM20_9BILA